MSPDPSPLRRSVTASIGLASLALIAATVPGAAGAGTTGAAGTAAAPEPSGTSAQVLPAPNVVFVLADDLGHNDLSTDAFGPGSRVIRTPALDRMAADGTVATNAYSSPTCSPTRMALLTGMSAPRPENNSYQVGPLTRGDEKLRGARQGHGPESEVYLLDATRTVAETARSAGYRTAYIGKFHVAAPGDAASIRDHHGFDVNLGGTDSGAAKRYHAIKRNQGGTTYTFDRSVGPGLDKYAKDYTRSYVNSQIRRYSDGVGQEQLDALVGTRKHVTDAIGDAMLDQVGVGRRPTFTVVGQYAVHAPVTDDQARSDLRAKYRNAEDTGYAALAEGMDQTMARLREHLETTPDPRRPGEVLADNTVVIFTSDNGGRTQQGADNTPYRGQKFQLLEGGVRVPFLAWSGNPDLVAPGRVVDRIVKNEDLYPTVAEYAGTRAPSDVVDGVSLVSTLAGGAQIPNREHVVHLPGYYIAKARPQQPETTLRWGDWKLSYTYEDRRFTLRNLAVDPGETRDFLSSEPDVARDLGERMRDWLRRLTPQLAIRPPDKRAYSFGVPAGTQLYRDERVVRIQSARRVVVRPGEEAPFVLPPVLRR